MGRHLALWHQNLHVWLMFVLDIHTVCINLFNGIALLKLLGNEQPLRIASLFPFTVYSKAAPLWVALLCGTVAGLDRLAAWTFLGIAVPVQICSRERILLCVSACLSGSTQLIACGFSQSSMRPYLSIPLGFGLEGVPLSLSRKFVPHFDGSTTRTRARVRMASPFNVPRKCPPDCGPTPKYIPMHQRILILVWFLLLM